MSGTFLVLKSTENLILYRMVLILSTGHTCEERKLNFNVVPPHILVIEQSEKDFFLMLSQVCPVLRLCWNR
jgi:hypothetical protein